MTVPKCPLRPSRLNQRLNQRLTSTGSFSRDLLQGLPEAAEFAEGKRAGARLYERPPQGENFKKLTQHRAAAGPGFVVTLPRTGVGTMLIGGVDAAKATWRDYIRATFGFDRLGEATGSHPRA